jgi:uncharacterized protein (TIGR00297 family)
MTSTDFLLIALFASIGYQSLRRSKVDISGYISILAFSSILILTSNYEILVAISIMFLASSFITTIKKKRFNGDVKNTTDDKPRNWKQALANVGLPSIFAIVDDVSPFHTMIFVSFASLACASADTWSSEIGVLSKSNPVFIISRKPTQKGVSGGVTTLGTLSSAIGSALIAIIYFVFFQDLINAQLIFMVGFIGSFIDSILGELFQAKYRIGISEITDDKSSGTFISGLRFMTNNKVNLIAVTLSAVIAFFIQYLIR